MKPRLHAVGLHGGFEVGDVLLQLSLTLGGDGADALRAGVLRGAAFL